MNIHPIRFSATFFLLLLASLLSADTSAKTNQYVKTLTILRSPEGAPYIVGVFDYYGAGGPAASCSQSAAQTHPAVELDEALVPRVVPPPPGCTTAHCYSGDIQFGECSTYMKEFMTDCGQGCVARVCTDNLKNSCCVECERGEDLCYGCKTLGYCS